MTREQLNQKIEEIVLVQGNQSAPALAELLSDVLDYVDAKYLDDTEVKSLGGVSMVGTGNVATDFGGAGFASQE